VLMGEISATRSFYFGATEASSSSHSSSEASPSEVHAAAAYTRRLNLLELPVQLTAGYAFGLTFLDGPPPLADEHHLFLEEHSGQIILQHMTDLTQTRLQYRLVRDLFADLARNTWGNEALLEHSAMLGQRARILGWLSFRHDTAQTLDYTAVAPGGGVGGSWRGPAALVFGLRAGYEHKDFYRSDQAVRWAQPRQDDTLSLIAEVDRALPWDLSLRLTYQRLENVSTVDAYTYSRDLFSCTLAWSTP
jgi:hypothetical protein